MKPDLKYSDHTPFTEASRITLGLAVMFFFIMFILLLTGTFIIFREISWQKYLGYFLASSFTTLSLLYYNSGKTLFIGYHIIAIGSKRKKPFSVKKRFAETLYHKAEKINVA